MPDRWRKRTACWRTASSESRPLVLACVLNKLAFIRTADRLFAQGETGWFVPTLRKSTRRLVDVALAVRLATSTPQEPLLTSQVLQVGRAKGDVKLTRAGEAARMLGRPMGIAASDRCVGFPSSAHPISLTFCAQDIRIAMQARRPLLPRQLHFPRLLRPLQPPTLRHGPEQHAKLDCSTRHFPQSGPLRVLVLPRTDIFVSATTAAGEE